MGHGGLATQIWYMTPALRRSAILVLLLLVGLLSWMSVALRDPNSPVAVWWPAAGVAVVAVLASRGSRAATALGVFVVAFAANALLGREISVSIGFAIANAAEAFLVAQIATRGGSEARLDGLRDVARFFLAALAGASAIAVIGAATVLLFLDGDFVLTASALLLSHGSAILLIAPIALVSGRLTSRAMRIEALVQFVVLSVLLLVVFWPGFTMPIAFLPLAALLWAAFRLPITVVAVELIVLAVGATLLAGLGGGAIGSYEASDPRITAMILQLFLLVHACAALAVAAARLDWASVVTQLGAREALLRSGIVNSETGILIGEILDGDRLRVIGVSSTALVALGRDAMPRLWGQVGLSLNRGQPVFGIDEVDDAVRARETARIEIESEGRRFDVDLGVHEGPGGGMVVTIVFTDVTTRDERERRAMVAAEQMRDLNLQKDEFIASVSHELRTPVTSILGFIDDLRGDTLPSSQKLAVEVIDRNARRLADVIENVLELSRLSSPDAAPRPATEVDLIGLVTRCAKDAEGLATDRAVGVRTEGPSSLVVRSSTQELTRVLANLLSNAVKFSPKGGEVRIAVTGGPSGVEIVISDDGPGIPPALLDHVWDRFFRVSDAAHRDVPGTGLGLPIVRTLVEDRLSGRVELESDGRTGTVARVWLPWDRDEEARARAS